MTEEKVNKYPMRPEEVRLLHALFNTKKCIRNCHELDGVLMQNLEQAIENTFEYFIEFMLQGLEE